MKQLFDFLYSMLEKYTIYKIESGYDDLAQNGHLTVKILEFVNKYPMAVIVGSIAFWVLCVGIAIILAIKWNKPW